MQKLYWWRRDTIHQEIVSRRAHRSAMRISHIRAWSTICLACDGSGQLKRDQHNKALAAFSTGKQYNAGLWCGVHIGALLCANYKNLFQQRRGRGLRQKFRMPCAAEPALCCQTLWLLRKAMAKPADPAPVPGLTFLQVVLLCRRAFLRIGCTPGREVSRLNRGRPPN